MSKPLKHLSKKWVFPITMPKITSPCGCCKSEIHPTNHAHLERYDKLYCDKVCLFLIEGFEYFPLDQKVYVDGECRNVAEVLEEMEVREYG